MGSGFRGGPVFPAIFIGIAFAELAHVWFDVSPTLAVAVGAAAGMAAGTRLLITSTLFAGLLVGLISGLVLAPFYSPSAIATTLFWAFFPELPFLVTLYRRWSTWLHYLGAVLIGVAYPILAAQSFDLWSMAPPLLVGFVALCAASCVGGTAVANGVADRLRAAGLARLARPRATV